MPINKNQLYARFEQSVARRDRLADLATRKALDLPLDDDMQINTTTNHHNGNWLSAAALGATLLLSGGGLSVGALALAGYFTLPTTSPQPTPMAPPQAEAQEFRVDFFTEEGELIEINE